MSEDIREQILSRLVELAAVIQTTGFRNQIDIPEDRRPATVILDGDEETDPDSHRPGRPPNSPLRVTMRPEVYFLMPGKPDTAAKPGEIKLGAGLNNLRRAYINAVTHDASLIALCSGGAIRYGGFSTGLAAGRSMEGEAGIDLSFMYVLRPDRL